MSIKRISILVLCFVAYFLVMFFLMKDAHDCEWSSAMGQMICNK